MTRRSGPRKLARHRRAKSGVAKHVSTRRTQRLPLPESPQLSDAERRKQAEKEAAFEEFRRQGLLA